LENHLRTNLWPEVDPWRPYRALNKKSNQHCSRGEDHLRVINTSVHARTSNDLKDHELP
jgi:hypothetical protein